MLRSQFISAAISLNPTYSCDEEKVESSVVVVWRVRVTHASAQLITTTAVTENSSKLIPTALSDEERTLYKLAL